MNFLSLRGEKVMRIDETKLKLYLNIRKKYIEFKKFTGISEIISGLSMFITLICSNFNTTSLAVKTFLYIAYFISVIIFLFGVVQFVSSQKNYFTIDLCFKEISSLDDTKKRVQYVIIIKDNVKGNYLLIYNVAWKCYLFPSYSSDMIIDSKKTDEEALLEACKNAFKIENQKINLENIGTLNNYKLNVSEKCFMNYEFRFFLVHGVSLQNSKTKLIINGHKFKWMPMNKMYSNKQMMKKNMDVIEFVNNHTNIAKI